jgi:hypothetical protein
MGIKSIYTQYDLYTFYNEDCKKFDENNKNYQNIRKIKINTSFIHSFINYLYDIYEIDEETRKWTEFYFSEITK